MLNVKDTDDSNNDLWKLPISNNTLSKLQQEDVFCKNILNQIEKDNIIGGQLYMVKDKLLKRYVIDGDNTYETTVVPRAITTQILQMAHDEFGGITELIELTFYLRDSTMERIKTKCRENTLKMCCQCQRRNKQVVKYATLHFDVAFAMQFISMDLIGEFHPPTSRKNSYALTVICMLTGYVFCVPLQNKTVEEVIQAYIDNIYSKFRGQ